MLQKHRKQWSLTALELWGNQFDDKSVVVLAESLKSNCTLGVLNFQDNQFGPKGTFALAAALKTNTTLTELDLSFNHFGARQIEMMTEAVQSNFTLTSLRLDSNDDFPDSHPINLIVARNKKLAPTLFLLLFPILSDPLILQASTGSSLKRNRITTDVFLQNSDPTLKQSRLL